LFAGKAHHKTIVTNEYNTINNNNNHHNHPNNHSNTSNNKNKAQNNNKTTGNYNNVPNHNDLEINSNHAYVGKNISKASQDFFNSMTSSINTSGLKNSIGANKMDTLAYYQTTAYDE
jgi:hypothetical protein